ncbi:hypothetical protein BH688_02875 [Kushneria phosphatilytica]|nr:hypothetical protein BH688_02875 [Kushneria phosphatilytica]
MTGKGWAHGQDSEQWKVPYVFFTIKMKKARQRTVGHKYAGNAACDRQRSKQPSRDASTADRLVIDESLRHDTDERKAPHYEGQNPEGCLAIWLEYPRADEFLPFSDFFAWSLTRS